MKKTPRPYQKEICNAIVKSFNKGERPYGSVLGGLGKSLCFAMLTDYYVKQGKRVLQLVPRMELVVQNYNEARDYMESPQALGICCGQLQKRQVTRQAVIAMASSFVSRRATSGAFDVLLIDECHRMRFAAGDEKQGNYEKIARSLLRLNPNMLCAGLSGSAYRLDQGELHETSHKTLPFFTEKVYDTAIHPGIPKLIEEGYLSPIETLNTPIHVDLTGVRTSGEDFNKEDTGIKFDAIIDSAVPDMRQHFIDNDIDTALIFASNLSNARHILNLWGDNGTMRIVCGDESICTKKQRHDAVEWLKHGSGKRYIINVDILAEGFDHRALQCVVLLRATKSPGLMAQIIYRIIRPHDDKRCGFLLDYGTNVERLGSIDSIIVPKPKKARGDAPKKVCTATVESTITFEGLVYRAGDVCNYPNILSARKCRVCSAEFVSDSETGLYTMRTRGEILKAKIDADTHTYNVSRVTFEKAYSKKDQTPMIKINFIDESGYIFHNYYMCLNHSGFARHKCVSHLMQMMRCPEEDYPKLTLEEGGVCVDNILLLFTNCYGDFFKPFKTITLAPNGKYKEIKKWEFQNDLENYGNNTPNKHQQQTTLTSPML